MEGKWAKVIDWDWNQGVMYKKHELSVAAICVSNAQDVVLE